MSALLLGLLLILLALVTYQIRMSRRVNEKLMKLIAPERDIRRIAKNQREEAWQHYRQGEFYSQLIHFLKLSAPIPSTRSWAASPDVLLTLFEIAQRTTPRVILDLGSGMSTLVLAKSAPQAKIISVDNSEEYAEKTRKLLAAHGITNVEIRVAPLTAHHSGVEWYDTSVLGDISEIDLLFIDGPPGSKNNQARLPAVAECLKKLKANAVIVIDDAARDGERAMAEKFAQALPTHTLEFLPHEKGTAIIAPR
ncbi:MAG: class I SAM-dependent methyltransferase [Actinobacteria bacterium]|nr:class I SAM-dependent methyltransferase [Actinomycetota bacterium]